MTKPQRIQLSRKKGFNLQAYSEALNGLPAVKVDRSTGFGNPFPVSKGTSTSELDLEMHCPQRGGRSGHAGEGRRYPG